ncbi:hypothetical protein BS78_04G168200 [Paspalum vaginatum]|nr:hypothetical protein BS78_04G168200 [Paspalum vaginatum]
MCTVAPTYAVPGGLPGAADPWRTMVPAATQLRGYADFDDSNAAADLPMQPESFLALPGYRYGDFDFEAVLRGLRSLRIPAARLAPPRSMDADADDATPKTPVAVLRAPISYGDAAAAEGDAVAVKSTSSPKKKPRPRPQEFEYDASVDATLRDLERRCEERPLADYLRDTQAGDMMMADRAELIAKMHRLCRYYDLAPGALHRAVSYVDRFLSAKKVDRGDDQRILRLGAAAVFAAAKHEDRSTSWKIDADTIAEYAGCTRREAVDAELELVAALRYRLSGPTAYTFVDHLMRNVQEGEALALVRSLAHHLADMALLDYRCVAFLPSAVAASAIHLAMLLALGCSTAPVAGYKLEELSDCMEAIYDMHENRSVWPGCDRMMTDWEIRTQLPYSLPLPPYTLIGVQ